MNRTKPQTTLYVIAYDIPNDRRRTKIHKLLCGFGEWTQFSLFECFLSQKENLILREKLDQLVEADEDSIRFYPLCANCLARVETIGSTQPSEPTIFVV